MSETRLNRIKYRLLKLIDISGFKVFDPVIRLLFGEEPNKQAVAIGKFLIAPTVFILGCLLLWTVVAPRHKTNSGEVPTPKEVWHAAVINQSLSSREDEKETDFAMKGEAREASIASVNARLQQKEKFSQQLKEQLQCVRKDAETQMSLVLTPLKNQLDDLKAANDLLQGTRQQKAADLAKQIQAGKRTKDELLALLRESNQLKDGEQEAEKAMKDRIALLDEDSKEVKEAILASDTAANEVQHLKKRLDYLKTGNRDNKVQKAAAATSRSQQKLKSATTSADILSAAKSVVAGEEKAQKTAEQTYPRRVTIWHQVKRSLFTVFIGFLLAAAIAIPLGIMCGLNKVVMACLTPIISIFKPVSPVVWLLIFQIVVGAFFLPDPDSYWLFEFCELIPFISDLDVNPALVFSACTVAMCALWPALVNTALGVSSIDQDHLNVARVLKLGLWSRLFKIIIPSSLPLVFAGLRISLGVGWMVLIAAEALSSSDGLGKYVWDEYQNGSSSSFANIVFACFLVGLIGFVLDRLMILMQRSVSFDDGAAVV